MPRYKEDINAIYISERMQERLRRSSECPLTTVTAPMGYGKTTAVHWYLKKRRQLGDGVFRVNIYSENPDLFWHGFCSAFGTTPLGGELKRFSFPEGSAAVGLVSETILEYLESREEQQFLFIDDFHLMEDARVARFLFALCDLPIESLHIIIASRSKFLAQSELLHFGSRLHMITMEDLRLNGTELSIYSRRCGITLSEQETEELLRYTEGWFSCAYLNLKSYAEKGYFLKTGDDIYLQISGTLIAPLNSHEQDLLRIMCLADEFTVEQAKAVTGFSDVKEIIRKLSGSNAFITYLSDTRTYRFHHMLRECMRIKFDALEEKEKNSIYLRYGAWYEKNEEYTKAFFSYTAATDNRAVLRVITKDVGVQLVSIAPAQLLKWLEGCTEAELLAEPFGILILMRRLFSLKQIPKMLWLKSVLVAAIPELGIGEETRANLLGECDLIMSFLGYNDIAAMSVLHQGACRKMTRPAVSIHSNGMWTFGCPSVLMMFHREAGGLDEEIKVMNQSMPFYYQVTDGHGMGAEFIMEAEAHFCRGNFTDARIFLEKAKNAALGKEQRHILLCCDFLELKLMLFGGDGFSRGWQKQRKVELKKYADPTLFTIFDSCSAYIDSLLGNVQEIPDWIADGRLEEANILNPARPMYEIIFNQVLLAKGRFADVIGRGETLAGLCGAFPYTLCLIYLHIQLAAAYGAMGKFAEGTEELRQAFDMAFWMGFWHRLRKIGNFFCRFVPIFCRKMEKCFRK